jgi:hypothetical protein
LDAEFRKNYDRLIKEGKIKPDVKREEVDRIVASEEHFAAETLLIEK